MAPLGEIETSGKIAIDLVRLIAPSSSGSIAGLPRNSRVIKSPRGRADQQEYQWLEGEPLRRSAIGGADPLRSAAAGALRENQKRLRGFIPFSRQPPAALAAAFQVWGGSGPVRTCACLPAPASSLFPALFCILRRDEGPRNGRAFSAAWHGMWLFPENPLCRIPCFRSRIHPVHGRGVVIKGIDGLKSAVRPFRLNQPLITVTQSDVKKRSSRGRPHSNNVAGICDGQRARLWNLVEKRSP